MTYSIGIGTVDLDMMHHISAIKIYKEMATFQSAGISNKQKFLINPEPLDRVSDFG
jgi:hypothetical protein